MSTLLIHKEHKRRSIRKLGSVLFGILAISPVLIVLVVGGCGKGGTPEQRFARGVAQLEQFQYTEAESTFASLGRDVPDRPWGLLGKGVTFQYKHLFIDALATYLDIQKLQSDFQPVLPYLAEVYDNLEESGLASRIWLQFENANEKDRQAPIRRIETLLRARRVREAQQALANEMQIGKIDSTVGLLLTAQTDWQRGFPDSAMNKTKELHLNLSDTTQLRLLANWLELREFYDSSMVIAEKLMQAQPRSSSATFEFLARADRIGDYAACRRIIPTQITKDTTTIQAVAAWLPYYWAKSDLYRADRFTGTLYNAGGDALSVPFLDIRTRWMYRDKNGAMENVMILNDRMGKQNVSNETAAQIRGPLIILFGNIFEPETDMTSLRAAPGWKNDELLYRQREARFYAITDQKDQFEGLVGDFLNLHRLESEWLASIGQLYLIPSVLDTVKAKGMFEEALRMNPLERSAFSGLLQIAFTGGPQKALAVYDAYPRLENTYPSVAMDKAVLLLYLGRLTEAEALFIGRRDPIAGQPRMQRLYLEALSHFGQEEAFRRGINLMTSAPHASSESFSEGAVLYMDDKRFADADSLVEAGLKLEPDHARLLAMRARIWYSKGKKEDAKQLFDSLLAAADGDPDANLYYSQALASDSTEPVKAGNLARQGNLMSQGSQRTMVNLIEVYLAQGRTDLASKEIEDCVRRYPDQPRAYYYYGRLMEKESPTEAKKALQTAVKYGLKSPERQVADSLIARIP